MAGAADGFAARAAALRKLQRDELKPLANKLRKELIASAKSSAGPDRALSGMGNNPKLGVRVRTETGNLTTVVTLQPSPARAKAPWRWMDQGTKPGRRRTRAKLETRRAAEITGVGAYFHPGTAGKNTWFGVTDPFLDQVADELRRKFERA
jgi:hypothetical protein